MNAYGSRAFSDVPAGKPVNAKGGKIWQLIY